MCGRAREALVAFGDRRMSVAPELGIPISLRFVEMVARSRS